MSTEETVKRRTYELERQEEGKRRLKHIGPEFTLFRGR